MSITPSQSATKVTVASLARAKAAGTPITAITAYDYPTARLADEAQIDILLVGDSLAMAVLGHPDTLSVTMDEMLHHTRSVRRGTQRALLLADMPYGSYHLSIEHGVANAIRFLKEAGAEAVKIEGDRVPLVEALTRAEIPVVGHLGLTPQSVHAMSGYRVQGKTPDAAEALLNSAIALQEAGAVALVLEGIPRELAARITAALHIPTIGIGAGPQCDGQILVFHDMFHLTFSPPAKFVRRFGDARALIAHGLADYREAVAAHTFPADSESYHQPAPAPEPAYATTAA